MNCLSHGMCDCVKSNIEYARFEGMGVSFK